MPAQYDEWLSHHLSSLIGAIPKSEQDRTELEKQLTEVEKGVRHGTQNPHDISPLLLKVSQAVVGVVRPALTGTVAAGTGPVLPRPPPLPTGGPVSGGTLPAEAAAPPQAGFDVGELKDVLHQRKKKQKEETLRGGLDLLKED